MQNNFGLVLHGGAAALFRKDMPAEVEAVHRDALQAALDAGYAVLASGGLAVDAVVATIRVLEDCPLFNSAHGAVLNADGECELDASIMDGRTCAAGSVAGVKTVRNPIELARDVMQRSAHVMLTGRGAEKFAQHLGYEPVPNTYFQIDRRHRQLAKARALEARQPAGAKIGAVSVDDADDTPLHEDRKFGTVGCAALDRHGNLAAGTSTGGMTNKKFGRVGDSPIIGAGTYANNATCALSATGHGEYFIRTVVGHDVSAQIAYAGKTLADATTSTLAKVTALGGTGGLIAIDREGTIVTPFTTPGMFRAWKKSTGETAVEMFGD